MRKRILLLLMVIGSTILGFSQTTYPRLIHLGPDTLLAITRQQLIDINRTINKAIHLEETNKILQMDLAISDSLSYFQNSIIEKQDSIIAITDKSTWKPPLYRMIYRNKSLITKTVQEKPV